MNSAEIQRQDLLAIAEIQRRTDEHGDCPRLASEHRGAPLHCESFGCGRCERERAVFVEQDEAGWSRPARYLERGW